MCLELANECCTGANCKAEVVSTENVYSHFAAGERDVNAVIPLDEGGCFSSDGRYQGLQGRSVAQVCTLSLFPPVTTEFRLESIGRDCAHLRLAYNELNVVLESIRPIAGHRCQRQRHDVFTSSTSNRAIVYGNRSRCATQRSGLSKKLFALAVVLVRPVPTNFGL